LHNDGDPVTLRLASGESATVPQGQTWELRANLAGGEEIHIDGQPSMRGYDAIEHQMTLMEGTTIGVEQADTSYILVSGWSV